MGVISVMPLLVITFETGSQSSDCVAILTLKRQGKGPSSTVKKCFLCQTAFLRATSPLVASALFPLISHSKKIQRDGGN